MVTKQEAASELRRQLNVAAEDAAYQLRGEMSAKEEEIAKLKRKVDELSRGMSTVRVGWLDIG